MRDKNYDLRNLSSNLRGLLSDCRDAIGDCALSINVRRGSSELLKLLFVLYVVRHRMGVDLETSCVSDKSDTLGERLRRAVEAMDGPDFLSGDLTDLYEYLSEISRKSYNRLYPYLIDYVMIYWREARFHSTLCPPRYFARTISAAVERTGSKTVLNKFAGVGSFGWTLPQGTLYRAEEESPVYRLVGEVLADAFGSPYTSTNDWAEDELPDAVIATLPINYCFDEVNWWECISRQYEAIQEHFLKDALSGKLARRMVAGVFHFAPCNGYSSQKTRKALLESGFVETVVTFPKSDAYNILPDANVVTSLVILDFTRKHEEVRFIAAEGIIRANAFHTHSLFEDDYDFADMADENNSALVSVSEIKKVDYAFNAYLFTQQATAAEGQKLVHLSDVADLVSPKRIESRSGLVAGRDDLSYEIGTACTQIPLREGKESAAIPVKGEAIVFALDKDWKISARINRRKEEFFVEHDFFVLKPKRSVILSEYLISILLTDKSLRSYMSHICEYYVDGARSSHLMYKLIPIYEDIEEQRKSVEIFLRKEPKSLVYNAVLVSDGDTGELVGTLSDSCIKVVAVENTVAGLEKRLKDREERCDLGSSFDLVIADTGCRYSGDDHDEPFDGLDAVSSLRDRYGLPVYLVSDMDADAVIRESGMKRRMKEYFFEGGRFFGRNDSSSLSKAILSELKQSHSEETVLRNRFAPFFEAAEWYDKKYGKKVSPTISSYLLQDESGIRPFNDVRSLTEDIIRVLQGLNVVPKELDPGAVPNLIRDRYYIDNNSGKREFYLAVDLMPKYLSSALVTIYDAGRSGSHDIIDDSNIGMAVINAFMAFMEWFYSMRGRFGTGVQGYYDVQNPDEDEFIFEGKHRGIVQYDVINGRRYYYCDEFHLQVDGASPQVKEGDTVIITKAKREKRPCKDGVNKFAGKNCYYKE